MISCYWQALSFFQLQQEFLSTNCENQKNNKKELGEQKKLCRLKAEQNTLFWTMPFFLPAKTCSWSGFVVTPTSRGPKKWCWVLLKFVTGGTWSDGRRQTGQRQVNGNTQFLEFPREDCFPEAWDRYAKL